MVRERLKAEKAKALAKTGGGWVKDEEGGAGGEEGKASWQYVPLKDGEGRCVCELSFSKKAVESIFDEAGDGSGGGVDFGMEYNFSLHEHGKKEDSSLAVEGHEYMIPRPLLQKLCDEYGFEIVEMRNFSQFYDAQMNSELKAKALDLMQKMSCLNHEGGISEIEWRLFSLYTTLVLQKKATGWQQHAPQAAAPPSFVPEQAPPAYEAAPAYQQEESPFAPGPAAPGYQTESPFQQPAPAPAPAGGGGGGSGEDDIMLMMKALKQLKKEYGDRWNQMQSTQRDVLTKERTRHLASGGLPPAVQPPNQFGGMPPPFAAPLSPTQAKHRMTGPGPLVRAMTSVMVGAGVKLAIIVPYRNQVEQNRAEQLKLFNQYMPQFLDRVSPPLERFKIFIVEQSDDNEKFNRGKLLNIGYKVDTA
jgi:hypothetical protein